MNTPFPLAPEAENNTAARFDLECAHHEAAVSIAKELDGHGYGTLVCGSVLHVLYQRLGEQDEAKMLWHINYTMRVPSCYGIPEEVVEAWKTWYTAQRLSHAHGQFYHALTWDAHALKPQFAMRLSGCQEAQAHEVEAQDGRLVLTFPSAEDADQASVLLEVVVTPWLMDEGEKCLKEPRRYSASIPLETAQEMLAKW